MKLLALLLALAPSMQETEKAEPFTFLFWTDQEINQGKDGDYSKCVPTIKAMNTIPGTALPEAIGGNTRRLRHACRILRFICELPEQTEFKGHIKRG